VQRRRAIPDEKDLFIADVHKSQEYLEDGKEKSYVRSSGRNSVLTHPKVYGIVENAFNFFAEYGND
jgi:hypothetical protein